MVRDDEGNVYALKKTKSFTLETKYVEELASYLEEKEKKSTKVKRAKTKKVATKEVASA